MVFIRTSLKRYMILLHRKRFNEMNNEKIHGLRPILYEDGIIRVKTQVIFGEDIINF